MSSSKFVVSLFAKSLVSLRSCLVSRNFILFAVLYFVPLSDALAEVTWKVSPGRSSIEFKVKHFVLLSVKGKFKKYEGKIVTPSEDDFTGAIVDASIPVRSIYTGNSDRDAHLIQEAFFHADEHPEISFHSTKVTRINEKCYMLEGEITIRGVTRPISLHVICKEKKVTAKGKVRSKFTATGKLNRYDFGLKWNDLTETGGMVVDDMVQVTMNIALEKVSETN